MESPLSLQKLQGLIEEAGNLAATLPSTNPDAPNYKEGFDKLNQILQTLSASDPPIAPELEKFKGKSLEEIKSLVASPSEVAGLTDALIRARDRVVIVQEQQLQQPETPPEAGSEELPPSSDIHRPDDSPVSTWRPMEDLSPRRPQTQTEYAANQPTALAAPGNPIADLARDSFLDRIFQFATNKTVAQGGMTALGEQAAAGKMLFAPMAVEGGAAAAGGTAAAGGAAIAAAPEILIIIAAVILVALIIFLSPTIAKQLSVTRTMTDPSSSSQRNPGFLSCWPADGPISQDDWANHLRVPLNGIPSGGPVDIAATWGGNLYAPISGTVHLYTPGTGPIPTGPGFYIIIDSLDGKYHAGLFHLLDYYVRTPPASDGEQVVAGQHIAYTDNSGNSSGSHVHYEFWGAEIGTIAPTPIILNQEVSHTQCSGLVNQTASLTEGEPISFGPDITGWMVETPVADNNIEVTLQSSKVCDWAEGKLAAAVNANFFETQQQIWGLAKQNNEVTNSDPGSSKSQLWSFVTGQSPSNIILRPKSSDPTSGYSRAVTGVRFGDLPEDARPRTILAVKNHMLQLIRLNSVTPSKAAEALTKKGYGLVDKGGREALMLDGGSSTKMYLQGKPCYQVDSNRAVPVSIGVYSGTAHEIKP